MTWGFYLGVRIFPLNDLINRGQGQGLRLVISSMSIMYYSSPLIATFGMICDPLPLLILLESDRLAVNGGVVIMSPIECHIGP